MHILFSKYLALGIDDTLPFVKSVRLSSCDSLRLVRINRLTELNQNNETPAEANTTAHFSTVVHETVSSELMYSDTPLNQAQEAYEDFPSHKYLLQTIAWTTASTGNVIFSQDIMNTFITGTSGNALGAKLANFHYFTADIKITIVVQGFSTNYGKYIVWFDPTPYSTYPGTAGNNVPIAGTLHSVPQKVRCEHVPHIEIDPSKDCTYELILKCPTPFGCYSRTWRTGSYRMGGIVFNPLNNGIGATVPNIQASIYMNLENVKLSVLTFTSKVETSGETLIPTPNNHIIFTSFTNNEQSKKPSTSMKVLSSGLQTLGSLPVIGKYATLASGISGMTAAFLEWFGFSKPVITKKEAMMLAYTCDEITTYDGDVHAHTTAARHTNSVTVDSSSIPFCDMKDQDIEWLVNQLHLVKQFTVLPAVSAGTAIADIHLAPNNLFVSDSPASAGTYEPSTLYYLASFFDQYRCDFLVEIEVVSSPLHRASLVVAYFPNVSDSSSSVSMALAQQTVKTTTIQVSGNSKTLLKIPYSQPQPYLEYQANPNGNYTSSFIGFTNGKLGIYLLNPVVSNGTGPIYLNVRMAGCNFMTGIPTTENNTSKILFTSTTPVAVPDPMCITDPSFYTKFFGEESAHTTKELASRATLSSTWKDTFFTAGANNVAVVYPANPIPGMTLAGTVRQVNFYDQLSIMYVGYKGSTNVTYYFNFSGQDVAQQVRGSLMLNDSLKFFTYADTMLAFTGTIFNYFSFFTAFGQNQNFVTAKIPYYFRGHFKPTFPQTDGSFGAVSVASTLDVQYKVDSTAAKPYRMAVATAMGDDGQWVGFRGIPLVAIS